MSRKIALAVAAPVVAVLALTGCKNSTGSMDGNVKASESAIANSPQFKHDEKLAQDAAKVCIKQVGGTSAVISHPFRDGRKFVDCVAPHGSGHKVADCFLPTLAGIASIPGTSRSQTIQLNLARCVAQVENGLS